MNELLNTISTFYLLYFNYLLVDRPCSQSVLSFWACIYHSYQNLLHIPSILFLIGFFSSRFVSFVVHDGHKLTSHCSHIDRSIFKIYFQPNSYELPPNLWNGWMMQKKKWSNSIESKKYYNIWLLFTILSITIETFTKDVPTIGRLTYNIYLILQAKRRRNKKKEKNPTVRFEWK